MSFSKGTNPWYYKKNKAGPLAVVGCCLAGIAIILLYLVISLGIIMGFWNWVVVPLAHVEPITLGQAFLIALFISLVGSAFRSFTSTK